MFPHFAHVSPGLSPVVTLVLEEVQSTGGRAAVSELVNALVDNPETEKAEEVDGGGGGEGGGQADGTTANPSAVSRVTLLSLAAAARSPSCVRLLVAAGADVNAPSSPPEGGLNALEVLVREPRDASLDDRLFHARYGQYDDRYAWV